VKLSIFLEHMIVNREEKNPKEFNNKMKKKNYWKLIDYCSKVRGYEV
jgi:hypothetical protein